MNCAWFEVLCRIPLAGLRLRLCRLHIHRCPRCQHESESADGMPPILVTSDRLAPGLDLWPGVKQGIDGLQEPAPGAGAVLLPTRSTRRWAYAAVGIMLLLGAGFWALLRDGQPGPLPVPAVHRPAEQTRLCSARIGNQPARVFQVQSRNPDRTIFWIAKNDKRS